MKLFVTILSAFALFSQLVSASIEVDDGVLVLTDANFDDAIKENSHILVEFYAPWCGHCKSLAPEYAKAAGMLMGETAKLAKVDATEHKEVGQRFGIQGFPTLKFFKNGKPSEYQGGRTASEIVTWLKKKSGPAAVTLSTEDDLLKAQEANDVVVVGVFESEASAVAMAFMTAAGQDDSVSYAISTAAAIKTKLAVGADTIVLLKDFDEMRSDLPVSSSISDEEIITFVSGNSVPLIQVFSQESSQKIFKSSIQIHSLFFTTTGSDHHEKTVAAFTEVSKAMRGKCLFINVPDKTENSKVLDYFGITSAALPAYVLADMSGKGSMKKYMYSGDFSVASISSFVDSFFTGSLKASLKSEDPSPEDTAGDVIVLKGKSFKELVLDNNKDVLVEFYAPWCGHCKSLAPIYEELGAKMKFSENIVIAKMDSTANEIDVDGVEVSGFPTLYFFPGDKKPTPVKYDGGRELDGFVSWLKQHAHHAATIHSEL